MYFGYWIRANNQPRTLWQPNALALKRHSSGYHLWLLFSYEQANYRLLVVVLFFRWISEVSRPSEQSIELALKPRSRRCHLEPFSLESKTQIKASNYVPAATPGVGDSRSKPTGSCPSWRRSACSAARGTGRRYARDRPASLWKGTKKFDKPWLP